LFLLYLAAGAGVGYGLFSFTAVGLPLSIAGGAVTFAILGQIHILVRSGAASRRIEDRLDSMARDVTEVKRGQKVSDARVDVVEQTVKVELTERRDALVSEMKQLEGLIERLTRSFESRLAETSGQKQVTPIEDAILRDVRDAL